MIKGISIWSLPGGSEGTLSMAQALDLTRRLGFAALEPAVGLRGELHTGTNPERCDALRAAVERSGVIVQTTACGLSWSMSPTSDDPSVRLRSIEAHAAALEITARLGASAMLMVPGVVGCPFVPSERVRYDLAVDRARGALDRLLDVAERLGVDLCIENVWNGLFLSPLELRDFVDSFASPRLGVYLDVGNLPGYHQHPAHWIELLGRRVRRVHLKDFKHHFGQQGRYDFCRLTEGDVPWPEVMRALRAIGYDRTLIAEMLPYAPGLPEHTSAAMDRILAMQPPD